MYSAGWWPHPCDPLGNTGEKIGDWYAARSEAPAVEGSYEISMGLPGVKAEKRFRREEKGRSCFFSERGGKEGGGQVAPGPATAGPLGPAGVLPCGVVHSPIDWRVFRRKRYTLKERMETWLPPLATGHGRDG